MRTDKTRSSVSCAVSLLSIAAFGALGGCGSVHGIPIAEVANDIAQTVCSKAWSCCTVSQLMGNGSAGTSAVTATADCTTDVAPCEHACEAQTAGDFRNQLSGVQRSVDQKRSNW